MNDYIDDLKERRNLVLSLCQAINSCRNLDDAARLVEDLLSEHEATMLAKRLKIAQLLIKNYTYKEIKEIIKVSENTISRVNIWLKHSGEGYKKAALGIKPLKKPLRIAYPFSFEELKRRYPLHFLTNHMVDELINNSFDKKNKLAIKTQSALKRKNRLKSNKI